MYVPNELDVRRVDRIKTIIKNENLKNYQFADSIGMTPENLSRILNNRHPVTDHTARRISKVFPRYLASWIMGYDDSMTMSDQFSEVLNRAEYESEVMTSALFGLARLSGFTVEPTEQQPDRSVQSIINAIKKGWTFSRDGRSVSMSLTELNDFENELCDYVEMRLNRMMK